MNQILDKINYEILALLVEDNLLYGKAVNYHKEGLGYLTANFEAVGSAKGGYKIICDIASIGYQGKIYQLGKAAREYIANKVNEIYW